MVPNILNYVELTKDVGLIEIEPPIIEEYSEYSKDELINNELNNFGFYLTAHPVSKYKTNYNFCISYYNNSIHK